MVIKSLFRISFLVQALTALTLPLHSQLAFPGAEGFGAVTRGAYSGSSTPRILIVDNLNPGSSGNETTGKGTFEWCVTRPYPRIVLFEVGGIIDYRGYGHTDPIIIHEPYLTVAGQTAPGSGISIYGTHILLEGTHWDTHDIIIQHLRIRHGDDPNGMEYNERDCLTNWGTYRAIIDHCSFAWSIDDIAGITQTHDVTMSNCIFAEPLHISNHNTEAEIPSYPEAHGYMQLMDFSYNITLKNNLIAYSCQRNPLCRSDNVAMINNMMFNAYYAMGVVFDGVRYPTMKAAYVGNVVLHVPSATSYSATLAGSIKDNIHENAQLYLYDNICAKSITNPGIPEIQKFSVNNGENWDIAASSPIDLQNYSVIQASNVENFIMENVGALPFNRDAVDTRILNNVQNRTGNHINSPNPLPARAYNFDRTITGTANGNLASGHDWAASPSTITINSTTINLNQDCNSLTDVVNHISPRLPAGIELYKIYGCDYLGFRTTGTGSGQSFSISGPGLSTFGIIAGTYTGSDGVGGFPSYPQTDRALASIDGYPSGDPHGDDNGNGYTNLEEWIYAMGTGAETLLSEAAAPAGDVEICQGTESTEFTTTGSPDAMTYLWQLSPVSAGIIQGSGKTIAVEWEAGFSGDCDLFFYAYGPGLSAVSPPTNITVSPLPQKPGKPAGPDALYQNSPPSGYSTQEIPGMLNYTWEVFPSDAGLLVQSGNTCEVQWDEFFFGNAYLKVSAENECGLGPPSDSLLVNISEVELGYGIINIFTPNGDGFNDYWSIPFVRDFPGATISIFNRDGELIHQYSGTESSWNGTVNGELVPMGTYLYVIDLGNGQQVIKGYLTILR